MTIEVDHHFLALAIRWLHVAAMSTLFGGALVVWWLAARTPPRAMLDIAVRYEQVFWGAVGVVVMTGVGNLGALGVALPAPATSWGTTFVTKIWLVALFVALSLPRTLTVARMAGSAMNDVPTLRTLYALTATLLAAILALAIVLAHG